jgi:hypothetical protein
LPESAEIIGFFGRFSPNRPKDEKLPDVFPAAGNPATRRGRAGIASKSGHEADTEGKAPNEAESAWPGLTRMHISPSRPSDDDADTANRGF